MPLTKAEIRNRALRKLGVLGKGETPDTATAEDMDAAYDEVYARVEFENLAAWAENASVPDRFVPAMVNLCALARVTEESISDTRLNKLLIETGPDGEKCINQIRARSVDEYESSEPAVYF